MDRRGILNGQIIDPFELPENLNREIYHDFLEDELPNLLEDAPLATRRAMWLQNDGCPAHYARGVRNYLDQTYPQRWIGRLGPILWIFFKKMPRLHSTWWQAI